MKAFIAACLILTALIAAITANGIILTRTLGELTDAALALPESTASPDTPESSDPAQIRALWEQALPLIALTVPEGRAETVERALSDLAAARDMGDDPQYRRARAELILLLSNLRTAEGLHWDNIL